MRYLKLPVVFFLFFGLLACSTKLKRLDTDQGTFEEAERLMNARFYSEAREQYFRIKTEFPESELQLQAALMIAETHFRERSYEAAARSFQDFARNYPGHEKTPYAVYRMGESHYRRRPKNFQRDSRATEQAVDAFTRLVIDFPDSEHVPEALEKIDSANDQLARKAFQIARFYDRQGKHEAAARRYALLMDMHADHPLVERAFARRIVMLDRMGETETAAQLKQQFEQMYPQSSYARPLRGIRTKE